MTFLLGVWSAARLTEAPAYVASAMLAIGPDPVPLMGPSGKPLPWRYFSFAAKLDSLRTTQVRERALSLILGGHAFDSLIFASEEFGRRLNETLREIQERPHDLAQLRAPIAAISVQHNEPTQLVDIDATAATESQALATAWAVAEAAHQVHDQRLRSAYRMDVVRIENEMLQLSQIIDSAEQELASEESDSATTSSGGGTAKEALIKVAKSSHKTIANADPRVTKLQKQRRRLEQLRLALASSKALVESANGPVEITSVDAKARRKKSAWPTIWGAIAFAIISATAAAFGHERLDARSRDEGELARQAQAPILGVLDQNAGDDSDQVLSLIATMRARGAVGTVAITGPGHGDLRTRVATKIAAGLARSGRTVALVTSEAQIESPAVSGVTRMLACVSAEQVVELRDRFDSVVLAQSPPDGWPMDSPAALPAALTTAENRTTAVLRSVDQTLLAVQAGWTKTRELEQLFARLAAARISASGVVWVKCSSWGPRRISPIS
ncbi:MAG: hypothetical protein ACKVX7_13450 [Planctomycetota bacterium]